MPASRLAWLAGIPWRSIVTVTGSALGVAFSTCKSIMRTEPAAMCRATSSGSEPRTLGALAAWEPPTYRSTFHAAGGPPGHSKTPDVSTAFPLMSFVGMDVYVVFQRMKWWLPGV